MVTYAVSLPERGMFEAWREAARLAISHDIPPEAMDWCGAASLFPGEALPATPGLRAVHVPAVFPRLAKSVMWHSAEDRFALLYQALWRMARGEMPLSPADPLGRQLGLMAKSVGRDIHKMHAFVRFREIPSSSARRRFVAWFEPDHHIIEPGSSFFVRRFADMDWMIAAPRLTARYENGQLSFGPGGTKPELPKDASSALWDTYFSNIFNPARVKLAAMRSEMPLKYWKNLPETRLIPAMLADAEARVRRMQEAGATSPNPHADAISTRYRAAMPQPRECPDTLEDMQADARQCRRCALCEPATQTVLGEGAEDARLMIVGEQPGNREDLLGRPFIGPAGDLLRAAMLDAGVEAERVWLTNAVKHFKFALRGKQRLHQNPDRGEIQHCRWWLGLELAFIQPRVTLALGASAAFALTDDDSPISARRGQVENGLHGGPVLISWHPAYILRLRDAAQREAARRQLVEDIGLALRMAETNPKITSIG